MSAARDPSTPTKKKRHQKKKLQLRLFFFFSIKHRPRQSCVSLLHPPVHAGVTLANEKFGVFFNLSTSFLHAYSEEARYCP